ncbi:MAG: hypothetical protein IJ302_10185, partial [Clostridia bacterium]|nr:hypothetical protein [Clostridia bacterium]
AGADGIMDEGIKPNLSEQLLPGHLVDEMHRSYRWLDTLYRLRQGKKQVGICPFFDRDLWKYNDPVSSLGQMTDLGSRFFMNLFCLGLSLTTRTEDADVMLLSGKTVRAMAPGQLRRWLGRGVYLDGTAALEVNRILAGDGICYTGVRGADYDPAALTGAHTSERFTDHPLNGADAGYLRYNIWGGSRDGEACLTADGAEILTYSMCPAEAEAGIVGMTFFENEIGGRTAVVSRGAWCPDILGEAKGRQIRRVMAALAGGALPCLLDAPTRCGISVWKSPHDRERAVYIYNTDFDAAEGVCLYTDRPFSAALIAADGSEVPLTAEPASQIALPVLPAWSCTAMVLRDET